MYLGLLPLLLPPTIGLLQHPSAHLSPKPAAGTTALASPPGFEAEYKTLREIRSTTSKPLLHLRQLEAHSPEVAQKLAQRVNFNVPKTGREAITTFFSHPTARFICCALGAAVAARFAMGMPLTLADGAAGAATGAFWMVQEWLIHDRLLHSDGEWFGERVHRWHHELPYYHVSLDGVGLAAVWFLSVATLLVGIGALTSSLAPCLTALAVYTLCGGIYEFAHYIAHTRVPLPAPLRKIRSHHTHHHTLSSDYWLAFTVPAVDSLFGTNPNPRVVSKALLRRQAPPGLAAASRQSVAPQPRRVSSTLTMCAAADVAAAGTSAVGATASATTLREELPALIQMARPNTIPMGAGLVILGAYGARHTGPLASGRLALGTLLTIIVTSASMLINDYHDHKLGVDNPSTKPDRPLVSGAVRPESVKLVLKYGYALHLTLLCLVDTAPMRLWVLANTLLTYWYSVHLKPITGVKNLVCAGIVAMAIGLGALATGGGAASIRMVWRPMAAVAGLIWHREMVMDIKDADGDRLAGGAISLSASMRGFSPRALDEAIELAPLWLLCSLVALTV